MPDLETSFSPQTASRRLLPWLVAVAFFMESLDTTILNTATPRALIVLDEIGRGTATYDGLSLAWAVVEHISTTTRAKTLFATHYHELTELADVLDHHGDAVGVALTEMATRCVVRSFSTEHDGTIRDIAAALALLAEAVVLEL